MDHLRFKSEQTAAAYVAGSLDPTVQERFELHLMECPECVEEVESWRAVKGCLPVAAAQSQGGSRVATSRRPSAPSLRPAPASPAVKPAAASATVGGASGMRWRVAAALAAGVIVGAAGGWYGRSQQGPSVGTESVAFYSLPPLMRGPSDCTAVRVEARMAVLALRVPAAAKEQRLVAVDSEGHDLALDDYSVATQADGSWLVRLRAEMVRDQGIRFEARSADGTVEPRGCILAGPQA
jgi:hypothetical protein